MARHLSTDTTYRCAALPRVFDILSSVSPANATSCPACVTAHNRRRASGRAAASSGNSSRIELPVCVRPRTTRRRRATARPYASSFLYASGRTRAYASRTSRSRNASSVRPRHPRLRIKDVCLAYETRRPSVPNRASRRSVHPGPGRIASTISVRHHVASQKYSVLYALRIASSRRLSEVPLSSASTASRPRAPHLYQPLALWSSYHIIASNLLYCVRD